MAGGRADNATGVIRRYSADPADNRKRLFALPVDPAWSGLRPGATGASHPPVRGWPR
ncbi:hypothetical protein CSB93_2740 [Pseudomonas paraeruginosa]|uniref:Uncharacterized protein n=1 Tax=Pseudomonas paraeruginosa TaxID=2994495 RepID=A0A2R3IRJ9_9PSED|nr:hypothetical protein CSB93_2740 [Pseudomonas paraeruginosa]AWE94009.1 hypothetical protein CSC28_1511 [Pseudomonas paraeruginosa]PTC38428.1 hypothetical protein CLJ1_1326 [Pseudomonas aeruginosa]